MYLMVNTFFFISYDKCVLHFLIFSCNSLIILMINSVHRHDQDHAERHPEIARDIRRCLRYSFSSYQATFRDFANVISSHFITVLGSVRANKNNLCLTLNLRTKINASIYLVHFLHT